MVGSICTVNTYKLEAHQTSVRTSLLSSLQMPISSSGSSNPICDNGSNGYNIELKKTRFDP